jgi:predicted metal-dependent phosphoesterase TrpH
MLERLRRSFDLDSVGFELLDRDVGQTLRLWREERFDRVRQHGAPRAQHPLTARRESEPSTAFLESSDERADVELMTVRRRLAEVTIPEHRLRHEIQRFDKELIGSLGLLASR